MFQTSAEKKVHTAAHNGAIISCADMLPQRQLLQLFNVKDLVILSECSELLKVIMLFLIKQFSSLAQRLLSEQHSRVCKVTLGCHHLDARVVRSVCVSSPRTRRRQLSELCRLHPFVHCLCRGRRPIPPMCLGGKKGWNEQKRSISSKELRASVEGNKRKLQDDNVENRAFFRGG